MTYIEKKYLSRRTYTLDGKNVSLSVKKSFGASYRYEFALEKLKATPDEAHLKDQTRTAYVGAPGFLIFLVGVAWTKTLYGMSPAAYYTVLGVGIAAMLFGFILGGRVKAYVFKNREETVVFDITQLGNSGPDFEAFVLSISEQIRVVQR